MARERMSRGDLLLLVAVLAAFGIVDAAYLTYQWYEAAAHTWCDFDPFWNCTAVRTSIYASLGGVVPTALVGAAGFAILMVLAVLALRGVEKVGPWSVGRWLLAFAALGGILGVGLTLVEIFVIQAICILCLLGFILDLGILGVAVLAGRAGEPDVAG